MILATAVATFSPYASAVALLLMIPAVRGLAWAGQAGLKWWMLGWATWPLATLAWALSPGLATELLAPLLCLPLAWLVGTRLAQTGRLAPMLDWGLPLLAATLALWGILQGPQTYTAKPQGPFIDPNTYAAVLNLLALPLLARWLIADPVRLGPVQRTFELALLATAVFAASLVASRGATLALLLTLPLILWSTRRALYFGRKLAILGVAGTWAYAAAGLAMRGVHDASGVERLLTTPGDSIRLALFEAAWRMIEQSPWIGHGLGAFRLLYPSFRDVREVVSAGAWVHNDYLQLWLEAGLPMFLLLVALLFWVSRQTWNTLKIEGNPPDPRIGYLAALLALFVQALVNFLFYFAFVTVLVGLYLAHLETRASAKPTALPRAARIAAAGYAIIAGWLMMGQLAVEILLGQSHRIQRHLLVYEYVYPRYEVAYWLSVVHPFHPAPHLVMGLELSDAYTLTVGADPVLLQEAIARMRTSQRLAPCYVAYTNDALALLAANPRAPVTSDTADEIVRQSLGCHPRHGLTHYYAGLIRSWNSEADALVVWHEGLRRSVHLGERLILAAAILSRERPERRDDIARLATEMAKAWHALEANPFLKPDESFWHAAQLQLIAWGGERFVTLVDPKRQPPSSGHSQHNHTIDRPTAPL